VIAVVNRRCRNLSSDFAGTDLHWKHAIPKTLDEPPAQPLIPQHASRARSIFQKDLVLEMSASERPASGWPANRQLGTRDYK